MSFKDPVFRELGELDDPVGGSYAFGYIDEIKGDQGYSFSFGFTFVTGDVSSSVQNSAPGEAAMTADFRLNFQVGNTTSERNSDLSYLPSQLSIRGYWAESSVLCKSILRSPFSYWDDRAWQVTVGPDGKRYCFANVQPLANFSQSLAVGETYSFWTQPTFEFTAEESAVTQITEELRRGPEVWVVAGGGASNQLCRDGILWESTDRFGCAFPGSEGPHPSKTDMDADAALAKFRTIVSAKGWDQAGQVKGCPLLLSPQEIAVGQPFNQGDEWGGASWMKEKFPDAFELDCRVGAMQVRVADLQNVPSAAAFLANLSGPDGWSQVSQEIPLHGGLAVFATDMVQPEGSANYPIVKWAWASGDLLIHGRLVRTTLAQTRGWLNFHLPRLVNGIENMSATQSYN